MSPGAVGLIMTWTSCFDTKPPHNIILSRRDKHGPKIDINTVICTCPQFDTLDV